jgi:group I intron endonuclease
MTGIYKITSPSGKIYIGQAVNIEKRKKNYSKLRCKKQPRLYNSLLKYGFSEHIFEVIEECRVEDLNTRERHWQDFYDVLSEKGLNCKLTPTDEQKQEVSMETRKKQSDSHTGVPKGPATQEHREKIRQTRIGVPRLQETKEKISKARTGIPRKKDTVEKIRKALTGKSQNKIVCPYCSTEGGTSVMKRWHFEKCKEKVG